MSSFAVSSSVMAVTDDKSSKFRKFCERAAELRAFEAEISLFNSPVSFFGLLDNDSTHKEVVKVCKSEFRCNCCKQHVHQLARFVDADGATFCSSARGNTVYSTTEEQRMMGELTHQRICDEAMVSGYPNWTLELAPWPDHYLFRKIEGGFNHYHLKPTTPLKYPETVSDTEFYNKALQKYVPLVHYMLTKFTRDDWHVIRTELPKLKTILEEATYGRHALLSISWFNDILSQMKDGVEFISHPLHTKMQIVGKSIIWWTRRPTDLTPEERSAMDTDVSRLYNEPIVTAYHQFNKNILNLLQTSTTEKEMRENVENRFNPNVYQRRTAAPKDGALVTSMKVLGDYSFTISTVREIEQRPECVTISKSTTKGNAMSHMKALSSKKSKYSFTGGTGAVSKPTTIKELLALIRNGEVTSLEINTSGLTTCYIAETTLSSINCVAPYAWAYLNGESSRFQGSVRVTHIMPICYAGNENYVFILENSKTCRKITSTVGWSEFLTPSIRRVAGTTFEAVAKTMPINYPVSTEELAIGVGTSKKNEYGKLFNSIYIRINNGNLVEINKSE